jgi:hypothetical protein
MFLPQLNAVELNFPAIFNTLVLRMTDKLCFINNNCLALKIVTELFKYNCTTPIEENGQL